MCVCVCVCVYELVCVCTSVLKNPGAIHPINWDGTRII